MLGALVMVALAAPPSAKQALEFAQKKQWEELYLGFAAASPEGVSKPDRAKIAKALAQGCRALEGEDPVMAFSLGDKSVAFEASADGLLCTAVSGKRADQRGAAEDALRKGAATWKTDTRFSLELGRLLLEDGQSGEAAEALGRVGKKSKEWAEAQRLLLQISKSAVSAAPTDGSPRPQPTRPASTLGSATSFSYESGEDSEGRRIRQNQYFRFRYFNAKRDFGQRADYEGAVQQALENARVQATRLLGVAREKPLDVILYSREEFRLHHGAQAAQSVAGFYSADAIRMNDSAEINDQNRLVLVHEYTHAVMDELLSFRGNTVPTWIHEGTAEYVEWRADGRELPPGHVMLQVRQLALKGETPRLAEMSSGMLIATRNPGLSYAISALGVRLLVARRSMGALLELLRDCGQGMPFSQALERHFDTTVERLDEELADSLKARE